MVSVLIPYYNWNIRALIEDLMISTNHLALPVEIVTCDDCSSEPVPAMTNVFKENISIIHLRNETNLGRSATRNRLISEASYEIIVFIDGDSRLLVPETYLSNYLEVMKDEVLVIGGTAYDKLPPQESTLGLHWNYGRTREAKSAEERAKSPKRYFFTNNFCCRAYLFAETRFDEQIQGYGYEDSEWASSISQAGVKITHINNNVIHKGLKNSDKFLSDADSALATLAKWHLDGRPTTIKLLQYYQKSKKLSMAKFLVYLSRLSLPLTSLLLSSYTTNLHIFDMYRLGRLDKLIHSK